MKAAVYYQNGGPEVFRYEDVADPVCGLNDVIIRVESIAIEGGDLIQPRTSAACKDSPHRRLSMRWHGGRSRERCI